ncbi:hypothetical protein FF011L_37420 [Roseimaritima multifibrata]|uniref:Uncharacterized protein n=1 Tax=Roseimaritima multifibrata TaxID=1930274 RepID=A0A517MJB9_9BACT|nr:hypothetical protein FF011L_37420 [Roseimaritima multifibrata]
MRFPGALRTNFKSWLHARQAGRGPFLPATLTTYLSHVPRGGELACTSLGETRLRGIAPTWASISRSVRPSLLRLFVAPPLRSSASPRRRVGKHESRRDSTTCDRSDLGIDFPVGSTFVAPPLRGGELACTSLGETRLRGIAPTWASISRSVRPSLLRLLAGIRFRSGDSHPCNLLS